MHALLVTVSIKAEASEEARQNLVERVVPAVRQAPGLVGGYWLAPTQDGADLAGYSVILFESEENASQAEQMARTSPVPDGVTFTSFEIREVIAHT